MSDPRSGDEAGRCTNSPGQPGEDAEVGLRPVGQAVTARRRRAATFVRTEDVSGGAAKAMKGTLNPVTRTKLKSGGGRPMVGTDGTVFFKRRSDDAPRPVRRRVDPPGPVPRHAGRHRAQRLRADQGCRGRRVGAGAGQAPGLVRVQDTPEASDRATAGATWTSWRSPRGRSSGATPTTRRSAAVHQWVDYADPRIQKGLSDLQLFDAISGQVDRHAGNIYVDPETGTVTGIDDDRAFGQGQNARDVAGQQKSQHYRGLPELVDAATADEILDRNPDDLREELARRENDLSALTDAEIDDAVLRLETVQAHLRDLKARGKLVTAWNDDTYRQQGHSSDGSYLGRQVEILADAFTGRLAEKGTYMEHRLRVTGTPKGVVPTVPDPPD